jgi:hypothetical protein
VSGPAAPSAGASEAPGPQTTGDLRRVLAAVVRLVLAHPSSLAALPALRRFARRRWWRRPPFLPLPDARLWAWRAEVVYGRPDQLPSAEELAGYLAWLARFRGWSRR